MKVLVIGAHADDPDLAAGGFITQLYQEGHEVIGYVASMFCARLAHIFPELQASWSQLGLKMLPYSKQDFDSRDISRQELLDELIRIREILSPDLVITHGSCDCHQSHKLVYEESIRAFKNCSILGYSFPWNEISGNRNNYFVKLNNGQAANKLIALRNYQSQMNRSYFSNEYQLNRIIQTGLMIGCEHAEAFETIRIIR